jgi:hypothetical protein
MAVFIAISVFPLQIAATLGARIACQMILLRGCRQNINSQPMN